MVSLSFDRASRALSFLAGWVRYGVVVTVVGAGVIAGADLAVTAFVRTLDDTVVRTPIDSVEDETPPRVNVARVITPDAPARDAGATPRVTATGFEHARPAPRLFERAEPAEVERIKASVSDHVVAASSEAWYSGNGQTFRTMCVRLCDGAYFPISFSTTRSRFARDEAVCASRCAAPSRLFVLPNPGGSPETMMDRSGHSYVALPTAFQFRRGNTPGCGCRPEAWEEAARARHREYAKAETGAPRTVADNTAGFGTNTRVTVTGSLQWTERGIGEPTASVKVREHIVNYAPQELQAAAVVPETLALKAAIVENVKYVQAIELEALPAGKSAKGRKARPARMKKPADDAEMQASETAAMENSVKTLQKAFSVGFVSSPIWGPGPNSSAAPRGSTARDIFARNFY